jgi:hypothetical protein
VKPEQVYRILTVHIGAECMLADEFTQLHSMSEL